MLYSAICLAPLILLPYLVNAASSISPDGVPIGSLVPAIHKTGSKTDFATIFSSIKSFKPHKQSARTFRKRDTVTPPALFEETFGPISAANNADGYMGFELLSTYDVNACAQQCNTRAFDETSGPCIFFNIWQAVVNGTPSAITCSLYNTFTDASTATNTGQGTLQISLSRGFSRISNVQDGSFQDYTCVVTQQNGCPAEPSDFWTRVFVESYDFVLVDNFPAHSGTSSCFLFFNPPDPTSPAFGSTLTYTPPLNTVAGQKYIISFFYTLNTLSPPPTTTDGPLFSVFWNNEDVLDVLQVGTEISSAYLNGQVEVTATGDDTLFFKNGVSFSHASYLDDIAVFQKWT
ncbi:hypothetical protein CPB84DRAFT_1786382 [Gymnopilus junonius]|uniref:Uncharacterized protein n=1 Tax=Gymnopilus junonius TaxID=109634 RepID=A0A9P5TJG3_GYMJU|nr:hypothetical protein CPB84DRAFT_1786382 [Gymnopilus junonius]